jgi:hypothetical protein
MIRQWLKSRRERRFQLENPYRMLPADDGGQSYQMECKFCKEWGNIMQRDPFVHTADCPAGKLEKKEFAKLRKG